MADLVDLPSWRLNGTGELIQQIAALIWLNRGDEHKELYRKVTGARVSYELYNRLSVKKDIEVFQNLCINGIVDYIKAHPKASEAELTKEVEKHVKLFKENLENL